MLHEYYDISQSWYHVFIGPGQTKILVASCRKGKSMHTTFTNPYTCYTSITPNHSLSRHPLAIGSGQTKVLRLAARASLCIPHLRTTIIKCYPSITTHHSLLHYQLAIGPGQTKVRRLAARASLCIPHSRTPISATRVLPHITVYHCTLWPLGPGRPKFCVLLQRQVYAYPIYEPL